MKLLVKTTTITAMIIWGSALSAKAQDATTILKNMDDVMYAPKDLRGTNTIVLIDKSGKHEVREATIEQKGTDMRLMRFTSPASQAGIGVLALPNDVMYLYLPAFGKERRISSSVKNQNFAGTDFSYNDMEPKPYSDKYTAQLLKTEDSVFVLELKPKHRSDYSRIIVNVNKANFYPEVMEYYDKGNINVKLAKYTFRKVGDYWNAAKIEMTDLKKNHKTIMKLSDVEYDTGLADDVFTVRNLRQ